MSPIEDITQRLSAAMHASRPLDMSMLTKCSMHSTGHGARLPEAGFLVTKRDGRSRRTPRMQQLPAATLG
jgi:hypothetical protein